MFGIQNARLLPGVLFLVLLYGCSSTHGRFEHGPAFPMAIQEKVELDSVPFYPQEEYQCGPAALATLLDDRGIEVNPDVLTGRLFIPGRKGSLQIEMVATARNYGLLAYKIATDIESILREINAGNPVLVMQNLSVTWWPRWHYAVIVGYDLKESILILRSGTIKRHTIDFYTFQNTWDKADNWAYVLVEPGSLPASAEPLSYIRASHELYQAGFKQEAVLAFRQAAVAWPQESIVLMALANTEYQMGDYAAAYGVLLNELDLRPANAAAWNNLAYTLEKRACYSEAHTAIQCARKLAPEDENIQQSLIEIMAIQDDNSRQCPIPSCP